MICFTYSIVLTEEQVAIADKGMEIVNNNINTRLLYHF